MNRTVAIKLVLPLLLASILGSHAAAKDINIGWSGPGTWTTLPFIVAAERGFFQKENLAVRMITFRGINVLMAALVAGELDYATILPSIAVAAARGIPVKILSSVTKGSSFALVSRAEIDSIQGLKGKRIGINSLICMPCAIGVLPRRRGGKPAIFVPAVPVVPIVSFDRTKLRGSLNGGVLF